MGGLYCGKKFSERFSGEEIPGDRQLRCTGQQKDPCQGRAEEQENIYETSHREKGQKINGGRPIVCVPVMAEREEEILRQAKDFIGRGARMLEWRLGLFEGLEIRSASEGPEGSEAAL